MATKKERKQQIKQEVKADKQKRKERKLEIKAMDAEQQKIEKAKDKQARKEAKRARKQEIKAMAKPEKKAAKKHDKIYKKVKNRPRRLIIWTAILCLVVYGVAMLAPIVGDVMRLMRISVDSSTPEGQMARENGEKIAAEISDEGIVLLQNDDAFLPLQDRSLNVFGLAAHNIRYGGGGSGTADQSRAVNLFQGLSNSGIQYNEELFNFYETHPDNPSNNASTGLMQVIGSRLKMGNETDEPAIDYLTDDMIAQAKQFSNNALIVLGSEGVEALDFSHEDLQLTKNKHDLLKRVCENFDNVIIIVNAGNVIELGFLEEYDSIKAAIWIGTPGPYGCNSLGKVLTGEVNPSGRLTDTYAYNVGSAPASVNFGDFPYSNIDGMAFTNYNEGIYVGYRYYETYYMDDEAGYNKAVQFPFGYGLSYTEFEWEVADSQFDGETIRVDINVTNTGDVPGKDVVQVYYSAPYSPGGIEKSAVELGGYAKTSLLQPGQSEVVTVEFSTRDMASYDMHTNQAYVLDAGEYDIRISRNVHEVVESVPYEIEEGVIYKTDDVTGTDIQNQFDYADGDLTYLSRNDWNGTYPDNSNLSYEAPQSVVDSYNNFRNPAKDEGEAPITGADNGIKLEDLKGLPHDDPKWQLFLDQFTVEEMKDLVLTGAYGTVPIDRLGIPKMVNLDGPAGINSFFSALTAASYPTEVVIAATWNDELAYKMGEAIGREANAYGVQGWYAPGMNIHRTPQGGRNFEYFSEDPLLSGKVSAAITRGAQSHDIIVFMKHFAMNDQETNARSGVFIWSNEQAIREIYLRPFEITVKEGKVTGAMSSFAHIGYKWSGANAELLINVLRHEWGFNGLVVTDAVQAKFMDVNLAMRYGNDLMLDPIPTVNKRYFKKFYKADPVGVTKALRECTHNICYAMVNYTNLF